MVIGLLGLEPSSLHLLFASPPIFPVICSYHILRSVNPMPNKFAHVAIPATADKLFTYLIPEDLRGTIAEGSRVSVPFGKRTLIGFVVGTSATSPLSEDDIKQVIDLLDLEPVISAPLMNLARWIAEYYCA